MFILGEIKKSGLITITITKTLSGKICKLNEFSSLCFFAVKSTNTTEEKATILCDAQSLSD